MIKNIFKKIKDIVGSNKKGSPSRIKSAAVKEDSLSQGKQKTYPKKRPYSGNKKKGQRRKETPEEYRKRRAKLDATGKSKVTSTEEDSGEQWNSSEFKVPVVDGKTRFHDFDLPDEILHAIFDLDFKYCTDVQAETLPKSLAGEDVTAQAQTGTGKTAAFLITVFNYFRQNPLDKKRRHGTPRALILAPTRELVLQIEKDARKLGRYTPCKILSLLGGIDYKKQQHVLKTEICDLLIGTPGRLIDFMNQKLVDLHKVEIFVIDEADRMLNMGFIPDVKKIVYKLPQKSKRQTMFFTATMSADVKRLAESWTKQAVDISVKPEEVTVDTVEQITYITTVDEKPTLLYNVIMQKELDRVLVFVNRRTEASKLKDTFENYNIKCALLTGDVNQKQRISRLERFRSGKVRVLVATDVASRGIHVEGISHVINYNMPQDTEEYVHRIGRTGRAGAKGISINFADEEDSHELVKLEEYLDKKIECVFPEENLVQPIPEEHLVIKKTGSPKKKYYPKKRYKSGRHGKGSGNFRNKKNSGSGNKKPG